MGWSWLASDIRSRSQKLSVHTKKLGESKLQMRRRLASPCADIIVVAVTQSSKIGRITDGLTQLLEELKAQRTQADHQLRADPRATAHKETEPWQGLTRQFGAKLSVRELKTIAAIVADCKQLDPPGRRDHRKKHLLVQWFDDNWECVRDILPYVRIEKGRASESEKSE
jgi:hypothetical protein